MLSGWEITLYFFTSFVIIFFSFFLLFPFNADIFWCCMLNSIAINLMWTIWLIEIFYLVIWLQGSDRSSRWTSCGTQEATKCISITCLIKTCFQGIKNAVFLQARERKLTPCLHTLTRLFCDACTYLQFNNKISYNFMYRSHVCTCKLVLNHTWLRKCAFLALSLQLLAKFSTLGELFIENKLSAIM